MTRIAPWLSVPDAAAAVDFYTRALGADVRERLEHDGVVQVAGLAIGDAEFWVQHEPGLEIGDAPVRMIVEVDDPDTLFAQAIDAGGNEINPVGEGHGWRIGRFADPSGHHWEIGRRL